MQTLKLKLQGSFYDSQIYSGRLYLWSNEGTIITLDWDKLIESITVPDNLRLALVCAFQQSEYLYGDHWKLVFEDAEIKTAIEKKFRELATNVIKFTQTDLSQFVIREQDNPLPFPHADCTIYRNILYLGGPSGVYSANCSKRNKNPISIRPTKVWDGPALSLAASYLTLAISAGDEGLFEYKMESTYEWPRYPELQPLIMQHSNSARWLFASMFSSSYFNEGYLADFIPEEDKYGEGWRHRELRRIIPSSEIFGHKTKNGASTLTWGVHDKVCFATQKSVEVVQYSPYKDANERFIRLGLVETEQLDGDIVSGDSALFGFIVEGEDGLLIINSLLESIWLPGEPVNWRVFPKSKFYTNQLHVIYDDHLCIHSFNQDYFVDQKTKKVGIRRATEFPLRSRR